MHCLETLWAQNQTIANKSIKTILKFEWKITKFNLSAKILRGVCCNIVLQFTNKQQGTAHRVVSYGTHSCQVRHTTDVKYNTHSCHVRSYVNDRSRDIPIQGTNVSHTRLRSYVTNNAYDVL